MNKGLSRFTEAQESVYAEALSEIKKGRKQGHWMWFIFPQIHGLGFSETSRYFAIRDIEEASDFLKDPVLGSRLVNICNELLKLRTKDAHLIFGSPDDMKLKSSMTLFASLPETNPVFHQVLEKYYRGESDKKTLELIR
jgi:uncharacterized protein (DUF1810 family)